MFLFFFVKKPTLNYGDLVIEDETTKIRPSNHVNFLKFLVKKPTLKYGDDVIEDDDRQTFTAPETLSCELNDAGPPQPDILELEVLEGDDVNATSSEDPIREDVTCSWSYQPPLEIVVNSVSSKVRTI